MINLKIDPEFQSQIPPLTDDEFKQLEENILKEGKLLSPLIVWNNTLVDGHNRYAILQKHPEIYFSTMPLPFESREAASNTIDENYDVPQKFLELYYRLHNAESLMRKSWEVTFDLNPKLLTHPEQVKVLRFALKPHLEFLKTLDEVLAESSGESSKTA